MEKIYLDTDIILALIKPEDWLKRHVQFKKIKNPVTSILTIIEAEIVLEREFSRRLVVSVIGGVKKRSIEILPLTEEVLAKSNSLLSKYSNLNIFDSVHLAFCVVNEMPIISTDLLFDTIKEVKRIDPREI